LIGWQRHAAGDHFRRRRSEQGDKTRRCGLGIPGYSDRAACKPSHTVQTVIGTEAAPECRPARRLTAASIGPGPTA
jgi:hypothetical protein